MLDSGTKTDTHAPPSKKSKAEELELSPLASGMEKLTTSPDNLMRSVPF